ncbi:MAG: cupin domain-containing protein [Bacteroidetes bacterium]|nr:MAG: cupin domain-containing protein [Bacteroidota bacterium]
MDIPESLFGEITVEEFLRDYWQKRPLLVRSAWPRFLSPLKSEDLINLAQRDDVDSRLILTSGGEYEWEARFGPFEEDDFNRLGEADWTLLVQEVDRLVPEVSELLKVVPFLPNWRIDDIMVSYATDGGGVGAHIDHYDVFLIQGFGKRKWEIEGAPAESEELVPDLDVRILSEFEPTDTWILEPGDLLYLPPRIAHRGTAVGECLTYSIGCRAPSKKDLVSAFVEHLFVAGIDETPFSGSRVSGEGEPGRISRELKEFAREAVSESMLETEGFDRWLGRYLSRSSRGWLPPARKSVITSAELQEHGEKGCRVQASSVSMIMYDQLLDGSLILFAGGEEYAVDAKYATILAGLTGREGLAVEQLPQDDSFIHTIVELINRGFFLIIS